MKKKLKYWYRFYIEECIMCGRTTSYKERVYGKKPKDPNKRYIYTQSGCGYHFM